MTLTSRGGTPALVVNAKALKKGRANNDHERKVEGSPGNRTGEPPQAEGMEDQATQERITDTEPGRYIPGIDVHGKMISKGG